MCVPPMLAKLGMDSFLNNVEAFRENVLQSNKICNGYN